MAGTWKSIRVFISSTFRDMHAERDHLVRFVFPELRARCAQRQLHLIDVDLRWGLTEEDTQQDKALTICLDEIVKCRPFFIGLLGERYGWVPHQYNVPDESSYDWVRQFEPGHSITALEIYHGVLQHPKQPMQAFFYFRDPAFLSDVPEAYRPVFEPESELAAEQLSRLKSDIRQGWPVFDYPCAYGGAGADGKVVLSGLEAFGQRVLEELWKAICAEYPETTTLPDALTIERAYHEAFIEERSRLFIGRADILKHMSAYADGDLNTPVILSGSPGSGKSALLASFARNYAEGHQDSFVLAHFVGASPGSTDIRRTLLRLCQECARRFAITDEIPEEYEKLRISFPMFLQQASSRGKVVLLLDALDQLDTSNRAHSLDWLPAVLPDQVRLIVSSLEGDCLAVLRGRHPTPYEIKIDPLALGDRKEIVRQMLKVYRKRLDERPERDQMGSLLNKREADHPLYLIVACEELRVFGEFEQLSQRIADLPEDIALLFTQVLERLEHDHGSELVRRAMSLLACARHGLFEAEMLELLRRDGEEGIPPAIWVQLYRSLQFYLRPPGATGEGRLGFFHQQLAKAVHERYLNTDAAATSNHRALADYFGRQADRQGDASWQQASARSLNELPFHLLQGHQYANLRAIYTNIGYLEAVCSICETDTRPDASIDYLGIFDLLSNLQDAYQRLAALRNRDVGNLAALLRAMVDLLVERGHLIRSYPRTVSQEIANYLDPAFASTFSKAPSLAGYTYERLLISERVLTAASAPGHTAAVTALAVSPDGKYLLSGGADGYVGYWRLDKDHPLWLVGAHKAKVSHVAISPDGRRGLSTGEEGIVLSWELDLAISRQLYDEYITSDKTMQWTSAKFCGFFDNETAIIHRMASFQRVDINTRREVWRNAEICLHVGTHQKSQFDLASDAKVLAVGGDSRKVNIANAETGDIYSTVESIGNIAHVAIASDASSLVIADYQGRLMAYDLQNGWRVGIVAIKSVHALCRAATGPVFFAWDLSGKLYKLTVGSQLHVEEKMIVAFEHPDYLTPTAMASGPDSETLVIGGESGRLRLVKWDSATVLRQWEPDSSMLIGAIFPERKGAIGIQGQRTAGEQKRGQKIVFFGQTDTRHVVAQSPHRHFVSGAAAFGPRLALTVDKGGTAVVWESGKVAKIHESSEVDFTCCTGWNKMRLGIGATQEEDIIAIGQGGQVQADRLWTSIQYRAGIAALAVVGQPRSIFAVYFNGEVCVSGPHKSWRNQGHVLAGSAAALDTGCRLVASGNINGEVILWRYADGEIIARLDTHQGEVTSLAFSSDGTRLYTAGADRLLYQIDTQLGQVVQGTVLPLPPIALLVEPNGLLSALDSQGNIYRFAMDSGSQLHSEGRSEFIEHLSAAVKKMWWQFWK